LDTWKDYFRNIPNKNNAVNIQIAEKQIINNQQELNPPILNYTNQKTNKAARPDNISPELIKNGGATLEKK
jgi:hypothetical protein